MASFYLLKLLHAFVQFFKKLYPKFQKFNALSSQLGSRPKFSPKPQLTPQLSTLTCFHSGISQIFHLCLMGAVFCLVKIHHHLCQCLLIHQHGFRLKLHHQLRSPNHSSSVAKICRRFNFSINSLLLQLYHRVSKSSLRHRTSSLYHRVRSSHSLRHRVSLLYHRVSTTTLCHRASQLFHRVSTTTLCHRASQLFHRVSSILLRHRTSILRHRARLQTLCHRASHSLRHRANHTLLCLQISFNTPLRLSQINPLQAANSASTLIIRRVIAKFNSASTAGL